MSNQNPAARAVAPKDKPPATRELPIAYTIIEEEPGRFSAVMLEGVTARRMTRLEANGQPEPMARAMARATTAIEKRSIARKWGQP